MLDGARDEMKTGCGWGRMGKGNKISQRVTHLCRCYRPAAQKKELVLQAGNEGRSGGEALRTSGTELYSP